MNKIKTEAEIKVNEIKKLEKEILDLRKFLRLTEPKKVSEKESDTIIKMIYRK